MDDDSWVGKVQKSHKIRYKKCDKCEKNACKSVERSRGTIKDL